MKLLFLLYVKGISEKIEWGCKRLGVRVIFKSGNTLRQSLMRVKNPRPADLKKGAVYEVSCGSCNKVYIGETGCSLKGRLKEHKYAVKMGMVLESMLGTHNTL